MDSPRTDVDPMAPARLGHRYYFAEHRIRKIVDTAPPLTNEQLEKLAALLLGAKATRE